MPENTPITVAHGDGIGPEIMDATLHILREAGARIDVDTIEIGEKVYLSGNTAGIAPEAWGSLRRTRVFLKAPITTPQGGGYKSLNVTARKMMGLYANIRPCVSYHPYVDTKHPVMDVVIVRENEEDTYGGIEHRLSDQVTQCLKLISRPGSEKIVRYAFEYARAYKRKKVTCFVKDNIMKLTDGLFHKVFNEIAPLYPEIEADHWIVDIGAAKLADTPENFDVIVMPNLYGDVLSDVAAQIAGSVGLAGSANIGERYAMFEAIHGSAPRRAGQNLANPSGLLLGAVQMLVHIGQADVAQLVHNAWLRTLEDGIHTYDIYADGVSKEKVGTREFANAVAQRVGKVPERLKAAQYDTTRKEAFKAPSASPVPVWTRRLDGIDIFIQDAATNASALAERIKGAAGADLHLVAISSRGTKVWPNGFEDTVTVDSWVARFQTTESSKGISQQDALDLLQRVSNTGVTITKFESLLTFDEVPGYSLSQGQ
ncbi:MAG: NADP-dependent isocitrate dehydrogenase [Capsulimonadaceae bacterium]|nr:NADP-dependent isocitrate dehydrogenase [Capsulimonadaceae bacterium]